jgi:hypothetical protein
LIDAEELIEKSVVEYVNRLEKELAALKSAIDITVDEVCEGFCKDNGGCGKFDDCYGCIIFNRVALIKEVEDEA